jgi:hypothetical protein
MPASAKETPKGTLHRFLKAAAAVEVAATLRKPTFTIHHMDNWRQELSFERVAQNPPVRNGDLLLTTRKDLFKAWREIVSLHLEMINITQDMLLIYDRDCMDPLSLNNRTNEAASAWLGYKVRGTVVTCTYEALGFVPCIDESKPHQLPPFYPDSPDSQWY